MVFSKENRTLRDDLKLGLIFGVLGGYINAVAITTLMYEIAPMSANWASLAKEIARSNKEKIFAFIPLIFCFIIGGSIGVLLVKKHNATIGLLAEALLLISIAFIARKTITLAVSIGGLAVGIQNGMTSYISHHKVRTTHLTSTVTDIGISLAKTDYKKALLLSIKTFVYICGAVAGVLFVKYFGNFAFVFGGIYILLLILVRELRIKYDFQLPLM